MNYRIFVEKKAGFDLEAKRLENELKESLQLKELKKVRLLNCYDIFGIEKSELEEAKKLIFSEVVTDNVSEELDVKGYKNFAVEFLPGQFDQRADSAMQCLNLISDKNQNVTVTSGKVIILEGNISDEELEKVKKYYINPVEMREKSLDKLEIEKGELANEVIVFDKFISYTAEELENFRKELGLAMTFADIAFVQDYFKNTEKRNPTETEIKVLDTYWSDHCRHTTFETKIKNIVFPKSSFGETLQKAFENYLGARKFVHQERLEKKIYLFDGYGYYLWKRDEKNW